MRDARLRLKDNSFEAFDGTKTLRLRSTDLSKPLHS
jgi:hypothetical protein